MTRHVRTRTIVVALVAVQAVVLFVVLRQSYFREDDFWFLAALKDKSFGSYLLQNNAGHLMPGQLSLVALAQWVSPLNFDVVAVMLVALQCIGAVLVWKLLVQLVGASWPAVVGVVVFGSTPLAMVASIWYAGALQVLPLQVAIAGVLLHHVRYLRDRRARDMWSACIWLVVGVAMWEKALVALLLAAVLTLLFFSAASGLRGILAAGRRDRRIWKMYAVVVAAYLPLYAALTTQVDYPRPGVRTYVMALWRALTGGAIPYLLGGPFAGAERAVADMPLVPYGKVYLAVFTAIVVWTVMRRRAAWRAWAMFGVYLVVNTAVITYARGGYFGGLIGLLPRYFGDLTLVAALCVPLALAPVRPLEATHDEPDPVTRLNWRIAVGIAAAVAYGAMGFVTASYAVGGMSGDAIRRFVATARHDLASRGDVVVYDAPTPPYVNALGSARQVLLAMDLPVRFGVPANQWYTLDFDGHLRPTVLGAGSVGVVDAGECGTRIASDTRAAIRLDHSLFAWRWVIRLDYTIASDAAVAVTAAGVRQGAVVHSSDRHLFAEVTGKLDHIDVGVLGGSAPMCLTGVTVGRVDPQPVPN